MKEIFKDIKGYEGCYQISNLGRVKSLKRKYVLKERILKPIEGHDGHGYIFVNMSLCKKGIIKTVRISRLVALTYIKNPNNYFQVDHIDRNTLNNKVDNLRWVNQSTNIRNSEKCDNAISKYNGVYWDKERNKWLTQCRVNEKIKNIGRYEVEVKAAIAFNKFCIKNNLDRCLNDIQK